MKMVSILPADSYVVYNRSLLNDNDRFILTALYQPIVGSIATSLYFTLCVDSRRNEEYTHHHLMNVMSIKLDDIVSSRKRLEAIGLLKSYLKENKYIYELYSPLSPSEFFSNPLLASSLLSTIGKKEYQDLVSIYKINRANVTEYENITAHFSDIYMMGIKNVEDITEDNIKSKDKLDIIIEDKVDFNFIISGMPSLFNKNALTKEMKELINKLAYLYNFDNVTLTNIIKDSLNEKGMISEIELKKNCKNYYSFETNSTPKLLFKSRETLKENTNEVKDLKKKLVDCFECSTPYDFLKAKYGGAKPTSKDINLIETLLVDQKLNPGVINVLIDYVLRTNDKKLNKNYVEAIASQWKLSNINNVKDAMIQAEKEYKKINEYKNRKENDLKITKPVEKLPTWYGKSVEKAQMNSEDIKELKDLLSEFE